LCEIDTNGFNSLQIPETKAKLELCADLLTPTEKFLKQYVLLEKPINEKVVDLHKKFVSFCTLHKFYEATLQKFAQSMREMNFQYKKTKGYNMYVISLEELQMIANKRKWIHELDEPMEDDEEDDDDEYDNGVDKSDKAVPMVLKSKYDVLKEELNALKKENAKLKELDKKPTKVKTVYVAKPSKLQRGLDMIKDLNKMYANQLNESNKVDLDILSDGKSKGENTIEIIYAGQADKLVQRFFD
jgi:N12 class adenine-specific DNA methylase